MRTRGVCVAYFEQKRWDLSEQRDTEWRSEIQV